MACCLRGPSKYLSNPSWLITKCILLHVAESNFTVSTREHNPEITLLKWLPYLTGCKEFSCSFSFTACTCQSLFTAVRLTRVQCQGVGGYGQPQLVVEIINVLLRDLYLSSGDRFNVQQGTSPNKNVAKFGSRRSSIYMFPTFNVADTSSELHFGSTMFNGLTFIGIT